MLIFLYCIFSLCFSGSWVYWRGQSWNRRRQSSGNLWRCCVHPAAGAGIALWLPRPSDVPGWCLQRPGPALVQWRVSAAAGTMAASRTAPRSPRDIANVMQKLQGKRQKRPWFVFCFYGALNTAYLRTFSVCLHFYPILWNRNKKQQHVFYPSVLKRV